MFRQVLSLTAIPQVPENIAQRKIIVYKSRVDHAMLKQKAEEMKSELFVKRFSKPKPEDIHVVSVDKGYEPYVLVDAKYRIEYFTKKIYSLEVAEKTREVKILGKVISLEGHEWSFYEDKAYFILDKTGREILPDQVPIAPSENNPVKILKEFGKKAEKVTISDREVIAIAKTKLIKRPSDVDTIENEIFHVTEYAIIYNPIYKITFRNLKDKKEESVSIDGVTAERIK
jgi:hypothetical protein